MAKPVITREQFINIVNERLPGHHSYRAGTRIFLVPVGTTGAAAAGYDFEPAEATGVVANVADQVMSEYDVVPGLRRQS
ncbi:hypothetical protein BX589_101276 [Paraburkholderia fungorum]|jgi:hypothetical protein|uniref:hypothetical protein n=1 Tax=Paraburkholderia fungorum TaxID=134537 RepID=UPI000D055B98|nr:hypothetical protein [Paraburkholderia fungorum]PRZ56626.1 hypothetical protein BX589_101276 [Paraburkholderia fungorum]